ncbi:hypothetical protein GCM10022384_54420 [Streptomyces marokkonensis]|uniref:Uncharacterized protein n=1 Tax=Streptomyces marokkonensis TaxID=324855 RepID=A0ABP7RQ39_9ACTN
MRLRLATAVGGMPIGRQASALRGGVEVVVATPGRLKDLVERGDCRLDRVRVTVLDEADQTADMGFMPQVTELLDQVRPDGQRMLFSATLDRDVDLLVRLLNSGVRAAALHAGTSHPQRTRTLTQFKNGHVIVLVATNVAARGIHVDSLGLVVNVDPPTDHKDYLHRGGRTARAGESGSVVTLVTPSQRRAMARLMATVGIVWQTTTVRAGAEALRRITGAQAPSCVPVVISAPVVERPSSSPGPSNEVRRSSGKSFPSRAGPYRSLAWRGRAGWGQTGHPVLSR